MARSAASIATPSAEGGRRASALRMTRQMKRRPGQATRKARTAANKSSNVFCVSISAGRPRNQASRVRASTAPKNGAVDTTVSHSESETMLGDCWNVLSVKTARRRSAMRVASCPA
ncbi:MAG TPA: hypothetical protein VG124_10900 [Beijerinckiaceae bacterium]|nr:hypothetical protein [Beijerinckiaceae bacterium]